MKKFLIGFCLIFLALAGKAQEGMEKIIVEKYYVSDANDAANAALVGGTLPVGSVTWRLYVDMAPDWFLVNVYGIPAHTLTMSTTTSFYNDLTNGADNPAFNSTKAKQSTTMIDSWLSTGYGCTGFKGVLKTEDDGVGTFVNSSSPKVLQNNDALSGMGIPLTTQDGLIAGTVSPVTIVGINTDAIGDGTVIGNTIFTDNGSWYSSSTTRTQGAFPSGTNRVLIAQITTDGTFHYEINVQVAKDLGGGNSVAESYVASNPQTGEFSGTQFNLSSTLLPGPVAPVVNITSPANNSTSVAGDVVVIAANATEDGGSITQVQFFVDGVSVGIATAAPFTANYTGVIGTHTITAVATDNLGTTKTSAPVSLIVSADPAPVVNITAPAANSSSLVGDAISITANATDNMSVASVEFFVDGVSLGIDNTAPYAASYVGVLGNHVLTVKATDNANQSTISASVSIKVLNNTPPSVSIADPISGQSKTINTIVPISANASDVDGTIASVEFKANGVSLGIVSAAPYTINWTPAVEGPAVLTAVATDNKGAISTSVAVNVNIFDPNALPYEISQVVQTCLPSSVCIPVVSKKATMKDVIGYDVVLNYDKSRVMPTGVISVSNALINPSYTSYVSNIDTTNSLMNISVYFNSDAVAGTNFHGAGQLFCAEFVKTANFKSVDTAVFSVSRLDESYASSGILTQIVKSGKFITYKDSTFHGSLAYWYDNSPIKYDIANPNDYLVTNIFGCGKTTNATQPDLTGNFNYSIWNGTSIEIKRDILNTTYLHSVLDADDALRTAKVAAKDVKLFTPSIYQMVAMDVNADGVISAGDASQISQRATGVITEFSQVWNAGSTNPSKDWLFVNAATLADPAYQISSSYPANDGIGYSKYKVPVVSFCQSVPVTDAVSCPLISSGVYTGIMLGDVNATYASIPHDGLLKSAKAASEIVLDLSKATVLKNGDISIPVSLTNATEVTSFDFDLYVNGSKAEVKSVYNPNDLVGSVNYVDSLKRLAVSLYSMSTVPAKNPISIIITKKSAEALVSNDFTVLVPDRVTKINGIQADLKVISAATGVNQLKAEEFRVYPNPASDKLNVEVSENSTIQMFDMNGKQVIETNVNADQKQAIDVQNLANGVYMIQVSNGKFVKMQKVVISK